MKQPPEPQSILETLSLRPRIRASCESACRPCPFVSCHHHLALDVTSDGALRFPHGHEPEDLSKMKETCALDVADDGGRCVNEVADLLGISRQRTAILEIEALRKLKAHIDATAPKELLDAMPALAKMLSSRTGDS